MATRRFGFDASRQLIDCGETRGVKVAVQFLQTEDRSSRSRAAQLLDIAAKQSKAREDLAEYLAESDLAVRLPHRSGSCQPPRPSRTRGLGFTNAKSRCPDEFNGGSNVPRLSETCGG